MPLAIAPPTPVTADALVGSYDYNDVDGDPGVEGEFLGDVGVDAAFLEALGDGGEQRRDGRPGQEEDGTADQRDRGVHAGGVAVEGAFVIPCAGQGDEVFAVA